MKKEVILGLFLIAATSLGASQTTILSDDFSDGMEGWECYFQTEDLDVEPNGRCETEFNTVMGDHLIVREETGSVRAARKEIDIPESTDVELELMYEASARTEGTEAFFEIYGREDGKRKFGLEVDSGEDRKSIDRTIDITEYSGDEVSLRVTGQGNSHSDNEYIYGISRLMNVEIRAEKVPQTESFSLNLEPGWNMISVPATSLESYELSRRCDLDSYRGSRFWSYDGNWDTDIGQLESGSGYFVKAGSDCDVDLEVDRGTQSVKRIQEGYNMISVPREMSLRDAASECELEQILNDRRVWSYDPATQDWQRYSLSDTLQPEKGYYIKSESGCSLDFSQEGPPMPR